MGTTYIVKPRKDSPVCDVHACEESGTPAVVNTFNREADAWQWVTEQQHARAICERLEKSRRAKS